MPPDLKCSNSHYSIIKLAFMETMPAVFDAGSLFVSPFRVHLCISSSAPLRTMMQGTLRLGSR